MAMKMTLLNTLASHRREILDEWIERIYASYPSDTVVSFRREGSPFGNPVGTRMSQSAEAILNGFLMGATPESLRQPVDDIVRIRAIQGFSPSDAVSFMFLLRSTVYDLLSAGEKQSLSSDDLNGLCGWIEAMAALSFDIYMECREQIFNLRISELKKSSQTARNFKEQPV